MTQSKPEKVSLDEVVHLVKQLPAEQQELLRLRLNEDAEKLPTIPPNRLMVQRIDIDQLAIEQGVPESCTIESLKFDSWPEDEDIEELLTALHQWRKESRAS
ncbi:MAG: hypothetical protein LCH63_02025 [Candidatus Melainabacteria bacterium]|jgi:hypothetical protein|nr:hypothetical protein [Candidatus Melainabacteria bacterium]